MKQSLNEEISKIKSMMGIKESIEDNIPEDVMKSIEADADEMINKSQKEYEDLLKLIAGLETAMAKPENKDFVSTLQKLIDDNKRRVNTFYKPEDKPRLIKGFIEHYKRQEVFRKYAEERAEKVKTTQITKEQIIDVFVTALEGGSNYWYHILDVPKEITYMVKQENIPFSEACGKYVLDGGELTIYDVDEVDNMEDGDNDYAKDKPNPLGVINMDSLLDTISIMKKEYPEKYENIIMDEYDADDADVFFQIATMGEIAFG